jgi:hypothetical protein
VACQTADHSSSPLLDIQPSVASAEMVVFVVAVAAVVVVVVVQADYQQE